MQVFKKSYLILCSILIFALNAHAKIFSPELHWLKQASLLGEYPKDQTLEFIVRLKLRNEDSLIKLAQDVYDINSPQYQKFLNKKNYEKNFAPSKETEKQIKEYFVAQGMQVKIINHSVHVQGSIFQVEQALHTQINNYQYNKHKVYANASAPKLNQGLDNLIARIDGLSNLPNFIENDEVYQKPHELNFFWSTFSPLSSPTDISLNGFTGENLQKVYQLTQIPLVNGTPLDGSGQTLVIVDTCGTNTPEQILNDANQYFNTNQINPFITTGPLRNFAIINPDGTPFTNCPGATSFSNEISLDVQSSHTIAPGDNTVLVLGNNQKSILTDVINTLIQDRYSIAGFPNAFVISNSWGNVEIQDPTLEATLALAAASGISVNFSSGDCGDNTYVKNPRCSAPRPASPTVNYPASSAYVTAVGATAIFVNTHYQYAFETVWGKVINLSNNYVFDGGTGGGVSQYYGPVAWQSSISSFTAGGYGVISTLGNRRAIPDIAMLGDPQTGLLIISNGSEIQDGGTSLACPLFSGTLLLVNQARNLMNKETPLGQAAPYLYQKNYSLLTKKALNVIMPPTLIISGASLPPVNYISNIPAPASSFSVNNQIFGWDSSLTLEPESQFWNDGVGVGSPNLPNFVIEMANM